MGGGGIPSNIGTIKVFCQKYKQIGLSKGVKSIPLSVSFEAEQVVGAIVFYGGYIGSQAMMDNNGNYNSEFGLSFNINFKSKNLYIYASSAYVPRDLTLMVFYI